MEMSTRVTTYQSNDRGPCGEKKKKWCGEKRRMVGEKNVARESSIVWFEIEQGLEREIVA